MRYLKSQTCRYETTTLLILKHVTAIRYNIRMTYNYNHRYIIFWTTFKYCSGDIFTHNTIIIVLGAKFTGHAAVRSSTVIRY
jgi:hypothetical protein